MTKDDINKMSLRELRGAFVEFCGNQNWATSSCCRSCPVYENDCGHIQWLASISEREIKEFLSGVITKEEADNVIHKETGSN